MYIESKRIKDKKNCSLKTAVTSGLLVENYILLKGTCLHRHLLQASPRESGISSERIYNYVRLNGVIFHKE
jgi:hypothetical protein